MIPVNIRTLTEYVAERIALPKPEDTLEGAIVAHLTMLAQDQLHQEELERKVKEYKDYWRVQNTKRQPWFPWKITIQRC